MPPFAPPPPFFADVNLRVAETACYVRADYSIVRSVQADPQAEFRTTAAFRELRNFAIAVIVVYAGLLPGLFFYLLFKERANLLQRKVTDMTRALRFLWRPYRPQFWYFEMFEIARKLFLVGFVVFLPAGSLVQIVWALNIAISVIAIEVQVAPFVHIADSYCSLIASLATIFILLMCAVLRTGSIVDELRQMGVHKSLWSFLDFELKQILLMLFAPSIGVFVIVVFFMRRNIKQSHTLPRVRHKTSGIAELHPLQQHRYHLLIAYAWSSGQDQAKMIKQLLEEVLPGVRIFIDVDDMTDPAILEMEVEDSIRVLAFISSGFFESKTCLRQFAQAVRDQAASKEGSDQKMFFVCESEHEKGMITEAQACSEFERARRKGERRWQRHCSLVRKASRLDLEPPEWEGWPLPYEATEAARERCSRLKSVLREKIHGGGILWQRDKGYQQASLLQIAEHLIKDQYGEPAYIPGGPLAEKVRLCETPQDGFNVYVSPNNAGALDFVYDELRQCFDGHLSIAYSSAVLHEREVKRSEARETLFARSTISRVEGDSQGWTETAELNSGDNLRTSNRVAELSSRAVHNPTSHGSSARHTSCVFLLYLDERTWTSAHADQLRDEVEAQLRSAMNAGVEAPILLVHERDTHTRSRHAIDFASFFTTTPHELIKAGLYSRPALQLMEGQHRHRSLRDAAEQLMHLIRGSNHVDFEERWLTPAVEGEGTKQTEVIELPDCFNKQRISGVDEDAASVQISPMVLSEKRGHVAVEAKDEHIIRGAFSRGDEGHRLTVVQSGGRKQHVLIDGVERPVQWQRRVERSVEECEKIVAEKGLTKQIDKFEWRQWKPGDLSDVLIVKVDEKIGGAVTVQRDAQVPTFSRSNTETARATMLEPPPSSLLVVCIVQVGQGKLRQANGSAMSRSINLTFDNPPKATSRLAILGRGLDDDVFMGKSRAATNLKTPDRIGDLLTEFNILCPKWPGASCSLTVAPTFLLSALTS